MENCDIDMDEIIWLYDYMIIYDNTTVVILFNCLEFDLNAFLTIILKVKGVKQIVEWKKLQLIEMLLQSAIITKESVSRYWDVSYL